MTEEVKRGRGRPKKVKEELTTPVEVKEPKKRGRKPKVKDDIEIKTANGESIDDVLNKLMAEKYKQLQMVEKYKPVEEVIEDVVENVEQKDEETFKDINETLDAFVEEESEVPLLYNGVYNILTRMYEGNEDEYTKVKFYTNPARFMVTLEKNPTLDIQTELSRIRNNVSSGSFRYEIANDINDFVIFSVTLIK